MKREELLKRALEASEAGKLPLLNYPIIDQSLREQLGDKPLDFGSVKIQIREGIPTLITVEQTIKLD